MHDFANPLKENSYKKEITKKLQKIEEKMCSYTEFNFFLKEVKNHYLYDFT